MPDTELLDLGSYIHTQLSDGMYISESADMVAPENIPSAFKTLTKFDIDGMMSELKATYGTTTPWFIAPKTYESIRFWKRFPVPTHKLRKCQLRRIAQRKRRYQVQRARYARTHYSNY